MLDDTYSQFHSSASSDRRPRAVRLRSPLTGCLRRPRAVTRRSSSRFPSNPTPVARRRVSPNAAATTASVASGNSRSDSRSDDGTDSSVRSSSNAAATAASVASTNLSASGCDSVAVSVKTNAPGDPIERSVVALRLGRTLFARYLFFAVVVPVHRESPPRRKSPRVEATCDSWLAGSK